MCVPQPAEIASSPVFHPPIQWLAGIYDTYLGLNVLLH